MAHVTEDGLVESDAGDTLQVVVELRDSDYGPLITPTGKPTIGVNHETGVLLSYGCDTSDCDGSKSGSGRVADGTKKYYANGILSRDGTFFQNVRTNRSCIATGGKYNGQEINRIAFQVEIANLGWARAKDGYFPTPAGQATLHVDLTRDDLVKHGSLVWQKLTTKQVQALAELWKAIVDYSGMDPKDALHGHKELNPSDGHEDPGPEAIAALEQVVYPFCSGRPYSPPFPWTGILLGAALLGAAGLALYLHQTHQRPQWLPQWVPT